MNRNEVEETVRLMRQIAAHRERAERYELAWTSARRRALGRREVIRRLRGQLAEVYATSAKEREDLEYAQIQNADQAALGRQILAERDEARRERDLAIAHDSQPYPTAWAYEQACSALERTRTERDEARDELVKLGKENEEHRRTIRSWQAAREADEAEVDAWLKRVNDGIVTALADDLTEEQVEERIDEIKRTARERIEARRLRAALDGERIEPEAVDLERFDSGAYTTPVSEELIQRVIAAAGLDEDRFRRESLGEWPLDPEPGCPAHGAHPHTGRRCLDCPACVGELRTEGAAG